MIDNLKFGTSGLRGPVTDLSDQVVIRYVRAFLRCNQGARRLLIGRDLRLSSPRMAEACITAASAEGLATIDCGALPTPALANEALRLASPAVMITGSHIPADRNGLKFYRADGEIDKGDEAAILAQLDARPATTTLNLEREISDEAATRYVARYANLRAGVSLGGLRIGVYQHSSVARDSLPEVLKRLGADVLTLGRASEFVPVDTEALRVEDVAQVERWSAVHRFDAIVSTDGDADRPLIADEYGTFLRGDLVGLMTSKFLGATTVVTPVTTTSAVELSNSFRKVVRTKVGSPYVIAGMRNEIGTVVGFEANGGVLLGSTVCIEGVELSALPTRDAFLPIIGVLGLARREGVSLSVLAESFPPRRTASGLLPETSAEMSAPLLNRLASDDAFAAAALASIGRISTKLTIDGVKFVLQDGDSIHFRASGNAPELRCYAESGTEERARALVARALQFAHESLVQAP